MAAIESRELIEDYFKEVKDKYPGMSFEKFTAICKAPFMFFRKAMEAIDFPLVHVKYFGKFVVWPGSAKKVIKLIEIMLRSGRITQEQYEERTANLKAYIEKYEYESQNPPNSQREETPD